MCAGSMVGGDFLGVGACGFLTERDGQGLVMSVGGRQMDDGDLFTAFPLVERLSGSLGFCVNP
jgi:hypothetical protein